MNGWPRMNGSIGRIRADGHCPNSIAVANSHLVRCQVFRSDFKQLRVGDKFRPFLLCWKTWFRARWN